MRWIKHKQELRDNKHYNQHLQKSWNKYGEENFAFSVLLECSQELLDENEINYIKKYNSNRPEHGYNQTSGGKGSAGISKEAAKTRGEKIRKLYHDNPEFVERNRQATLKQFQNEEFYKKYRSLRSSKEYRDKISCSHLGKKQTEETKEKIGKYFSKAVKCIETGIVYPSARAASRAMPGNLNIQAAAGGIRNTAGGYHWVYV